MIDEQKREVIYYILEFETADIEHILNVLWMQEWENFENVTTYLKTLELDKLELIKSELVKELGELEL